MNDNTRILIIEDDRAVRNLISNTLKINRFNYDLAVNGSEALLLFTTNKYDIVL